MSFWTLLMIGHPNDWDLCFSYYEFDRHSFESCPFLWKELLTLCGIDVTSLFVLIFISFLLQDTPGATRTLDLASTLEVGSGSARPAGEADANSYNLRSVLTIAFQFTFENHTRDNVAAMARQYVRSVVGSVQRVAMAISPSRLSSHLGPKPLPQSPEALTLAQWICRSYRFDSYNIHNEYCTSPRRKISICFISFLFAFLLQDTHWRRDFSSGFPVWWCCSKATLAPYRCNYVLLCQNKCIDSLLSFFICWISLKV